MKKNVLKEIRFIAVQTSNIFILEYEFYIALRLISLAQKNVPYIAKNVEMNNPLPNFDLIIIIIVVKIKTKINLIIIIIIIRLI